MNIMNEPTVTIKFTQSELKLVNEMIGNHISDWQEKEQLPEAKYNLQKELLKIEDWIDEKKQEAINDKKASEGSFKEQTEMETKQRICIPCED